MGLRGHPSGGKPFIIQAHMVECARDMIKSTFDSTKKSLRELLEKAAGGAVQLPDFQRGWVWGDEDIRGLLASISQSFPVGALMTLETGGEINFKPRPVEGAPTEAQSAKPEALLLDGQQRITSLFQTTIRQTVVETVNAKKRAIKRWYYINIEKALDPVANREEAIIGLPDNKRLTSNFGRDVHLDLSKPDSEYERLMFPVNQIFTDRDWEHGFEDYWRARGDHDKRSLYRKFYDEVIRAFDHYQLPVITLAKETPKQAVCLVFEKVNTGGKKLDAFELLTAIYAADEFELRKDWYGDPKTSVEGRLSRLRKHATLDEIASTDFLQAIALLSTRDRRRNAEREGRTGRDLPAVSCTRATILDLPLNAYTQYADQVERGFILAARFLKTQKIYRVKDVPYKTQIVPLAAVLSALGDLWDQETVKTKIRRWFWCGIFGELYGSAIETRFAKDFIEIRAWIEGGTEPDTVTEASFRPDRLDTMRTRLSAAYKGVYALLMREGARDLRSGQAIDDTVFWDEHVDIHHIFPQAWCKKADIDPKIYDAVVNRTPLTRRTNRIIGGDAPSKYLSKLVDQDAIDSTTLDECLASHLIDPTLLRTDDFDTFYRKRKKALLDLISEVMGKSADEDTGLDEDEGDEVLEPEEALESAT